MYVRAYKEVAPWTARENGLYTILIRRGVKTLMEIK